MISVTSVAYGLVYHFHGNEYVNWHKGLTNLGSPSNTYINKNNYETYVSLGLQRLFVNSKNRHAEDYHNEYKSHLNVPALCSDLNCGVAIRRT